MKSYLKYRALVYDPTANRQWESVNSPAEERLMLTRPGRVIIGGLPLNADWVNVYNATRFQNL